MSSNIYDTNLYAQAHTHNHSRNWVLIVVEAEILWEEEGFQFGFKWFQGRPSHIKPHSTPLTRSLEPLLPKWHWNQHRTQARNSAKTVYCFSLKKNNTQTATSEQESPFHHGRFSSLRTVYTSLEQKSMKKPHPMRGSKNLLSPISSGGFSISPLNCSLLLARMLACTNQQTVSFKCRQCAAPKACTAGVQKKPLVGT